LNFNACGKSENTWNHELRAIANSVDARILHYYSFVWCQ